MGLSRSRLSSSLDAFWSPIHWKTFVTFTLKSMARIQVVEPVIDLTEDGLGAGRLLPQEKDRFPITCWKNLELWSLKLKYSGFPTT